MSFDSDDKCLVCLKAGCNLNIFTTYNVNKGKEELYVEVIKNCFNIEISPDCGLNALCNECSLKLQKAYNFRHDILQAVDKLISAQVTTTNEKQYSEIEYLEDIPFQPDYGMNTVLNPETGQITYALDEIYEGKEITENNEPNYLIDLDNDIVVDKVLFNKNNENISEVIQNDVLITDNADSELNLEPDALCLLDKPVENYTLDILSDLLVDNDLEPGEIRVIDNTAGHYLIDTKNEVIVDKKKVIVKSKGKINARSKNALKTTVNEEAGPVNDVDKTPINIVSLVNQVIDEKCEVSKTTVKKCVKKNVTKEDKSVPNQVETFDERNTKDLTVDKKRRVNKRNAKNSKIDELSLLAQICTKQPNSAENPTANAPKEINKQETKDDQTSFMDIDNNDDKNVSKVSKARNKKTARKKEDSLKENESDKAEKGKAKRTKKEKKAKPATVPFTLQPNQTVCDICKARFETTRSLSTHMNSHYPQFVCGNCGVGVATANRLRQHMRIHEEGPFTCKVCDKEFSNSNTRNAHQWRVHSKGDPFKCRHCAARFPTYLQRLRHVQSAHGETPEYACQFCQAKFAYAANRTKHIRTMHLKERPHPCPKCTMAFARARNLAAHLASKHGQGQKAHRCPTCGISFYFRSALRWHVSQHRHKFECNQCDQKFATSAELESHTQIHEHADNMAINLDFVTSLQLDALADEYDLIDPLDLVLNDL